MSRCEECGSKECCGGEMGKRIAYLEDREIFLGNAIDRNHLAREKLEQRIAELEAECDRWADADIEKDGKVFHLKERIAELEQAIADHIRLQGIQFENGVKEGMERDAEIVESLRNDYENPSWNDALDEAAEAIRKEIDND